MVSQSTGSVFTSYAKEDRERVQPLAKYLSSKGIKVWLDTEGIDFDDLPLDKAACVLVIWTANSVRSESVLREASKGRERGTILPVLLDSNAQIPVDFTVLKSVDLTEWDGSEGPALIELAKRVGQLVERGPAKRAHYETPEDKDWVIDLSQDAVSELSLQTSDVRYISGILRPDSAQAKNVRKALEEVGKTYRVVNTAINDFINAGISVPIDVETFVGLDGDTLRKKIRDGKGNCDQILNYYGTFDGPREWIKDKISPKELKQVDATFNRLGRADGDLFEQLAEIGNLLAEESRAIVGLLIAGQEPEARQRVIEDRTKLEPVRAQLSQAIQELERLQGYFGYAESV
jgi:hypothetical protein